MAFKKPSGSLPPSHKSAIGVRPWNIIQAWQVPSDHNFVFPETLSSTLQQNSVIKSVTAAIESPGIPERDPGIFPCPGCDNVWPQPNIFHPFRLHPKFGVSGPGMYPCPQCGKIYKYKRSMSAHLKVECGKEPQLPCPYCPHRSKKNHHLAAHIRAIHKDIIQNVQS
ncbi:hypothetical protein ANN_25144 [Periplaneta americana]|uniref:C2H2-type domain-containing protein n=1 Tax=Periplaneta americana TaxID=6978 RepID=A0ABQ8S0G9_PERAM|nr:hypothetical protein ANN_25144 [Periplaneta americana]